MPARSERMYIFPDKNGEPCWIRPFPLWWNRSEFINRYHHREIDLGNPIDANYVWLLDSAAHLCQLLLDWQTISSFLILHDQEEVLIKKHRWGVSRNDIQTTDNYCNAV